MFIQQIMDGMEWHTAGPIVRNLVACHCCIACAVDGRPGRVGGRRVGGLHKRMCRSCLTDAHLTTINADVAQNR